MTTRTTDEPRLRRAVASADVAALVAPLRCVARIDPHNLTANVFCLVFDEGFKLRETPRVKSPFRFAASHFDIRSNVREVFDNNHRARFDPGQDALAKNMVTIASEPRCAARKGSKMPFGGLRPVRLQLATKAEYSTVNLPPMLLAVRPTIGRNSRTADTKIDPNRLTIFRLRYIRHRYCHVQYKSVPSKPEFCASNFRASIAHGISGNRKWDFDAARHGCQIYYSKAPVNLNCVTPKMNRLQQRRRKTSFLAFSQARKSGFDRLSRYLPRVTMKIGKERRECVAAIRIG